MTKITDISSDNMDQNSSKDYTKNFSKRMLKTHLFVGTFQEKRYVESLNSYRDVVKVSSDETEFIENLLAVWKKLRHNHIRDFTWIGITGPETIGAPVGYNLWVVLPIEVFGTYWFKVKTVEFLENEVRLKLDVVRTVRNEKSTLDASEVEDNQNFDLKSNIQNLLTNFKFSLYSFVKNYVTLKNITESVIFVSLLIGTVITGGVNIIKYLMEYLLKFMKETSGFIKVCTPIIISCIELMRKTIFGLFSLIVALVHGKPAPPQPVNRPYYINPDHMLQYGEPYNRYSRPALTYGSRYRSSVKIEPLDD